MNGLVDPSAARIWVLLSAPGALSDFSQGSVRKRLFRDGPPIPIARWVEPTRYDIFEPDGVYVGQVEIPQWPDRACHARRHSVRPARGIRTTSRSSSASTWSGLIEVGGH